MLRERGFLEVGLEDYRPIADWSNVLNLTRYPTRHLVFASPRRGHGDIQGAQNTLVHRWSILLPMR